MFWDSKMNPHRNEAGDKAGFQIEKLDGVRDVTVNQITNASSVTRLKRYLPNSSNRRGICYLMVSGMSL